MGGIRLGNIGNNSGFTLLDSDYSTLVEESPDPILVHDLTGKIVYCNLAAAGLLGYTGEKLDLNVVDIVPPSELKRIADRRKKRVSGLDDIHAYETLIQKRGGAPIPVYIRSKPITIMDGQRCIQLNIRNITDLREKEKELRESQERLIQFMEGSIEGFVLLDSDLRLLEANSVWLEQANASFDYAKGKHITEILPRLEETGRLDVYETVLKTGESHEFSHVIPTSGGDVWFNIKVFKVGENIGVITNDITEQMAYEQKLHSLHSNASDLARVNNINEIAEITENTLFGVIGFTRGSFGLVEGDKLVHRYRWGFNSSDPFILELDGSGITVEAINSQKTILVNDVSKNQSYITAEAETEILSELCVPIFVRNEPIALLNIESTEKDAFTSSDQELVEILASHISAAMYRLQAEDVKLELLNQMKQINEELSRSNTDLENYTYIISHDLKAPLRSIKSFSSFLEEDYGSSLDSEALEYLNRIVAAVTRMDDLISDLLTVSRIGRKFMDEESVDLNELLDEILADLSATIKEKSVLVQKDDLPTILTQKVWIRQLFTNLISNGIKFNDSNEPTLNIQYSKADDFHLFKIQDNGIGISSEYHERIFNLFERLHTVDEYPGTGAGLAICKKIVDNFGGKIWVESEGSGDGSVFCFTFPVFD